MQYIKKSILDVEYGIIVHQVNYKGVMNAGLAKQIRQKWPIVYTEYKKMWADMTEGLILWDKGFHQCVKVSEGLIVCNLFGQNGYGTDRQYTDYSYVNRGLSLLDLNLKEIDENPPIYFPYKIGCGLGGGDWNTYSKIIEKYFPEAFICQL